MALVKFYRGNKGSYSATTHADGIYFAQDTAEILMNGVSYGSGVTNVTLDGNVMTFTSADGTQVSVTFPYATEEAGGWMSAEDKATLDNLSTDVEEAIKEALAQLNYTDTAVDASFVTAVNETEGVIEVTRGKVTSTDGSITVTPADDGGIDLGVNFPEETAYTGKDAITVEDHEIALTINESDVVLSQNESGLKTTLTVDYDSDEHTVNLKGIDGAVISSFDATEFIVDGMIQKAELVHENPDTGETGEFLAITFNTEHGETTTIYIDVAELIDTYTAGNGLELNDHEFSVKIADSDEGYLQVTEAGLKTEGISTAITEAVAEETSRAEAAEAALEEAIEAAKKEDATEVVADSEATHITVTSETGSEGQTIYTIGESDIASAETVENIITATGLASDGTYVSNGGTYTSGATSIEEEIAALDEQLASVSADLEWIEVE